jgi:hypothetical protein
MQSFNVVLEWFVRRHLNQRTPVCMLNSDVLLTIRSISRNTLCYCDTQIFPLIVERGNFLHFPCSGTFFCEQCRAYGTSCSVVNALRLFPLLGEKFVALLWSSAMLSELTRKKSSPGDSDAIRKIMVHLFREFLKEKSLAHFVTRLEKSSAHTALRHLAQFCENEWGNTVLFSTSCADKIGRLLRLRHGGEDAVLLLSPLLKWLSVNFPLQYACARMRIDLANEVLLHFAGEVETTQYFSHLVTLVPRVLRILPPLAEEELQFVEPAMKRLQCVLKKRFLYDETFIMPLLETCLCPIRGHATDYKSAVTHTSIGVPRIALENMTCAEFCAHLRSSSQPTTMQFNNYTSLFQLHFSLLMTSTEDHCLHQSLREITYLLFSYAAISAIRPLCVLTDDMTARYNEMLERYMGDISLTLEGIRTECPCCGAVYSDCVEEFVATELSELINLWPENEARLKQLDALRLLPVMEKCLWEEEGGLECSERHLFEEMDDDETELGHFHSDDDEL